MNTFLIIIAAIAGALVGWYLLAAIYKFTIIGLARRVVRKQGTEWIEDPQVREWVESQFPEDLIAAGQGVIQIAVEQDQGQLFAYTIEPTGDRYLTQAPTAHQLIEAITQHFADGYKYLRIEVPPDRGGDLLEQLIINED